jgi:hypothetical protein
LRHFSVSLGRDTNDGLGLVCELAAYCGHFACVDDLQKWQIPKLPVDGLLLVQQGVTKDKRFGATLEVQVFRYSFYILNIFSIFTMCGNRMVVQ